MNKILKGRIGPSDERCLASLTRDAIAARLPSSNRRIDVVANSIGFSARTLQRLLGREGISYSKLVDEVRLALARDLLDGTEYRLSEIAERLGYSDAAHFTRAFRRWTGKTPSEHRRDRK